MPMVDKTTRGTATVELTVPLESGGILTLGPLHGCFVKKDANLKNSVENFIDPSVDRNKYERSKYLVYSPVSPDLKDGVVTKAVISYEKISKKLLTNMPEQKTKTCTLENPLVIAFDGHFFLCCDSEVLNKSKFLEEHSKVVRINQPLDPSKSFYGLGMESDSDNKCLKFISFNMSQCRSQSNIYEIDKFNKDNEHVLNKLNEAGPLLLDDNKTIVGCYKKSNSQCRIKMFEKIQDSPPSTTGAGAGQAAGTLPSATGAGTGHAAGSPPSATGAGTEHAAGSPPSATGAGAGQQAGTQLPATGDRTGQTADTQPPATGDGTGQTADTQPPATGDGTGQTADTQLPATGDGTGQTADTQPPAAGDGTGHAAESGRVLDSPNPPGDNQQSDVQDDQDDRSSDNSDRVPGGVEQQDAPPRNAGYPTEEQGSTTMPNDQPNLPNGYTLADLFGRKTSVLDGLCLRLDNDYKVLENWRHLADHLKAPIDVKESCKCSSKHSPTELLLELPKVSSVTITRLLQKLREMRRNDVVLKITDKIFEADRDKTIDETLKKDNELCDEVALLLDKDSGGRLINNWRKLGQKLGVPRDDLDLIGRGNNPANKLFRHAYNTLEPEKLKAGYFRRLIENSLDRSDVKGFLDTLGVTLQDDRSIKDVFRRESDDLRKLCGLLNRNAGGTLKDWKHLASEWEIKYDTYESFDDTEKPKPTKILLEDWLVQEHEGFTVEQLCTLLKVMKRNDVREYLENEASR